MTRIRSVLAVAIIALCLGWPLAACDQSPAQKDASAAEEALPAAAASTAPSAGEPLATDNASAGSSMAEDSPAGEGVTAEEIPHSDVPPPSREVFTDADCDFEDWVGKPVGEVETAVKDTERPYRILTPDSVMTMDHSPDRINVVHDKDGKVTRVWCG